RQMEPLFCLANFDRLRVEGFCKVQQATLLQPGMHVLVEPEARGEQLTELTGHTGTITALATSRDGRLLASASEDRTARLWHWPQATSAAVLPHPTEVGAVVILDDGSVLTGTADGRLRRWSAPWSQAET